MALITTAIVYSVTEDGDIGELIGYFEIYDTGYGEYDEITDNGEGTITNGNTIDIFRDSHSRGRDFISKYGDKCYPSCERSRLMYKYGIFLKNETAILIQCDSDH